MSAARILTSSTPRRLWLTRSALLLTPWLFPAIGKAADPPGQAFSVTTAPISETSLPAFPFVPALEGFRPADPKLSVWNKDTDFARYLFQPAPDQAVEVGGRFLMKHFNAIQPGRQSTEKIVESYRALFEGLGGTMLYSGRFSGGRIDTSRAPSSSPAKAPPTCCARLNAKSGRRSRCETKGSEYVLVVLEKGPLVIRTAPLRAADLKKSLDETGKAVLYVNFEYDRAVLKPDAKPVLDEVASVLKADPALKLSIEGHTDNLGSAAYNQSLSERRAAAVLASLVERGLLSTNTTRLQSAGRGASAPIADNKTDEGRARNRRVELIKRA